LLFWRSEGPSWIHVELLGTPCARIARETIPLTVQY
jgi:hypothetical protein